MKLNKKNKMLVFGFIVSLYVCYNLALSKTLFYRSQYKSNLEIEEGNLNNPRLLAQLKNKETEIDKWLLANNSNLSNFQNELLKQISEFSETYRLKVVDFKEPHRFMENKSVIENYTFSVEGSFNNTLIMLNKMENKHNLGQVKHVSTQKKMNYKTNEDYLITTVVIQKTTNNLN